MRSKKLVLIIYIFINIFSINAQQYRSNGEIANIIRTARNEFINYNYQRALLLLNEVIEEGIEDAYIRMVAFMERGNTYLNLKRYQEALNDLNTAIALDFNIPLLYVLRADTYSSLERYDEALYDIGVAIKLDSNLRFYINRARIYIELGRYEEAINETDYILSIDPNYARAYLIRASAYSFPDYRNEEEMLLNINKAIALNPNDAEFYIFRGRIFGARENYTYALGDLNRAIELEPNNYAEPYDLRSIVYRNLAEQAITEEQRIEYLELMRRDIETYRRLSGF